MASMTSLRTISTLSRLAVTSLPVLAVMAMGDGPQAAEPMTVETIADTLTLPNSLVFLPNGDALIGEKGGRILVLHDGRLLDTPIKNMPSVYVTQLGGLMDIAPDPAFAETSELFISYAKGDRPSWSLVLARAKLEDGALQNMRTILEIKPSNPNEMLWGGYLAFWRDGTLLMHVSDGGDTRALAQRADSFLGKVLRIDKEGKAPADNPFANVPGKRPEIFTMGHRHMIGLLYDPIQDIIYANENGPWGGDEINILQPGRNYGWPIATYGMDYSGAYVSPFQSYPGTEQPILHWTPSIAPSGMAQCRKCQWPEWEGDLFAGALSGRKVMRVKVEGSRVIEQESMFVDLGYRIRDLAFGPDGALYIMTDEPKAHLFKVSRSVSR